MSYDKPLDTALKNPKGAALLVLVIAASLVILFFVFRRDVMTYLERPEPAKTTEENHVGTVEGGPGSQNSGVNKGTMINGGSK
ncbi:MAG: hypothetical protein ACRYGF_03660 [Janthinobacterium lividum]